VRAGAAFVACALVAAAVLPGDSVTDWSGTIFATFRVGNVASLGNQSLHGMLMRIGLSPAALPIVWVALVAVGCGAAPWRARRLHAEGETVRAACWSAAPHWRRRRFRGPTTMSGRCWRRCWSSPPTAPGAGSPA
jgi:hypothetical protein